jgi:tetratricopeptide (TPR) repeat protein
MVEEDVSESSAWQSATGADPAAMTLALAGASRERADAFLKKQEAFIEDQRRLAGLQAKELAHELALRHRSLLVRHFSGLLKLTLEVSVALLALALVCGVGVTVWNAAHANGLIVESFKVPPDLAGRGLSGDVVASHFLDQLAAFEAQSANAIQAPTSITSNWSDDLKVEIPDTGISLGEFNRYLRRWLGHETHVSGEVVRLEGGNIQVTARVNSDAGQNFSGNEADFHALLTKAAEAVYAKTQPIRYGNMLAVQGRGLEEEVLLRTIARTGSVSDRAWAYSLLSSMFLGRNQTAEAIRDGRAANVLDPSFGFGWYRTAVALERGGAMQGALDAAKKSLSETVAGSGNQLPVTVAQGQAAGKSVIAHALGDFDQRIAQLAATFPMIDFAADPATQTREAETATGGGVDTPVAYQSALAIARIGQHDLRAARRVLAEEPSYIAALKADPVAARRGVRVLDRADEFYRNAQLALAIGTGAWALVRQMVPLMEADAAKRAVAKLGTAFNLQAELWPDLALAEAQMGDFAAAHAQIDRAPADCDLCLRTRAKIDALQKNLAGADFWLARLEAMEPSIPFADQDWGAMLLERGAPDAAIEKFRLANLKGPHFADPLEGWGEALMAKNRSDRALAKFAEAEKYAPNWGRLHLKWGEALVYAGHQDEAKTQFARAAGLDLTAADKAELARFSTRKR